MDHLLYSAYEANRAMAAPARFGSAATLRLLDAGPATWRSKGLARHLEAASSVITGAQLTHVRPAFERMYGDDGKLVDQVAVAETPFATLLHFKQQTDKPRPKVLIAAPMSGHFATMLSPTVRTMLTDHDVYITDWHNARDIPRKFGRFGLDEYVDHLVRFLRAMGPGSHLFAVCQPCPAAIMATAALAEQDDPAQPSTLTLMSGPVDTRAHPTLINKISYKQPLSWYRRSITAVPWHYPGAGRAVYPGFLQVGGFISLNMRRHMASQLEIYRSYVRGESASSKRTRDFYAEYFAVLDMPAEFYLESVEKVFQKDLLARGEMTYHGKLIRPELIEKTALLTIEAERDDMCAPGQTAAAHELFTGIDADMHRHHLQPGVGHYGVFAGSKWTSEVYPVITDFIRERATT